MAYSLWAVRDFLIATNLSSQTLHGSETVEALNLLAPGDPARRELEAAFTGPSTGRGPLQLLTRFDGDEVQVLASEGTASIDGTMTYEVTPAGEVLVHTDYTFVYAVVQTSGAKRGQHRWRRGRQGDRPPAAGFPRP